MVKTAQEVIALDGRGVPVVALQGAVMAHDGHMLHGDEALGEQGEEVVADGNIGLALLEGVADIEAEIAARFQHAVEFAEDLGQFAVVVVRFGRKFTDALRFAGITQMVGVGRIHEDEIHARVVQRHVAGVGLAHLRVRGLQVETDSLAPKIPADVQGGPAAGHGVQHRVARPRVAFQQIPDDIGGRGTGVGLVALRAVLSIVLRGVVPQGGGGEGERGFGHVASGGLRANRKK